MTKKKAATHKARKAESRKRTIEIETPVPLIDAVLDVLVSSSTEDLADVEAAFYTAIHAGGINRAGGIDHARKVDEKDYPRHLYAPGLKSLTDLRPALLDTKEALPPLDLLPDSSRALDTFLRRLVLIGIGDEDLPLIISRWPVQASTMSPWLYHVMRVWKWRGGEPALYKALVLGRFATVVDHLRRLTRSDPELAATLRRDLHVQALIWCAHDVQMVVARLAISDAVFGPLVSSTQLKLSPEGLRNRFVGQRGVLETILDLLYRSPEWRERDLPPPDLAGTSDDAVTSDPLVIGLARRIEQRAQVRGITVEMLAAELASRLAAIARRLRENGPELAVSLPPTDEEKKQRSLAAARFGLSPVAAAAVPILRLVQAEQQMGMLIDEALRVRRSQSSLSDGEATPPLGSEALPPFDPEGWGDWHERARLLLDLYRRRLLRDVDYVRMEEKDRAERKARAEAKGEVFSDTDGLRRSLDPWKAMQAAQDFLKACERRIGDHRDDQHDRRRKLYLLDVLPEYRFAEGTP